MNDLNVAIITGRLTRDVEFINKDTFQIAKFSVAVNYNFKKNGEWTTETTYLDCVAWNALAEIANRILHKGCLVSIEGRHVQETWTAEDGTNRSRLIVRVNNLNKIMDAPNRTESEGFGQRFGS